MDTMHPMKIWRYANNRKTLTALASEVGVSVSHLSEIENGNNEPSLDLALKLSRITGIDVAQFSKSRGQETAA